MSSSSIISISLLSSNFSLSVFCATTRSRPRPSVGVPLVVFQCFLNSIDHRPAERESRGCSPRSQHLIRGWTWLPSTVFQTKRNCKVESSSLPNMLFIGAILLVYFILFIYETFVAYFLLFYRAAKLQLYFYHDFFFNFLFIWIFIILPYHINLPHCSQVLMMNKIINFQTRMNMITRWGWIIKS